MADGWLSKTWDRIGSAAGALFQGDDAPIGSPPGATPPIAGDMPAPGGDITAEVARNPAAPRVMEESVRAAAGTSAEDKAKINEQLVSTFGSMDELESQYNSLLEAMGGKDVIDVQPTREDIGLTVMDFGLRLMAASGQTGELGEAIGTAGAGALGTYQDRMEGRRNLAVQQQGGREQRAANLVQGAGRFGRPFSSQVSEGALVRAGMDPDIAARISYGGLSDPAETRLTLLDMWNDLVEQQRDVGIRGVIPGTTIQIRNATPTQLENARESFIAQEMRRIYSTANVPSGSGVDYSPASEGRSIDSLLDQYAPPE